VRLRTVVMVEKTHFKAF